MAKRDKQNNLGTPVGSTFRQFEVEVYVNEIRYPVNSVSFSGDSIGGLPEGMVHVGSGKKSRTGTIEWGNLQYTPSEIQHRPTNPPYRKTPAGIKSSFYPGVFPLPTRSATPTKDDSRPVPKKGDRVVVYAKEPGRSSYRSQRFTGYIRSTTSSLEDGTVTSAITDGLDEILNIPVTLEPYCLGYNGAYALTPLTQVCKALETVGLGILPAQDDKTLIQTSQQYGFAPIQGRLRRYGNNFDTYYTQTGISSTQGLRFYLNQYAAFHRDKAFIHLSRFDRFSQSAESVSGLNSEYHELRVQYYPKEGTLRVCILDWSKSSTNPGVYEIYKEPYSPPQEYFGQYVPTAVAWTPTTCWIFTGKLDDSGIPIIVEKQIVNTPLDWNKQIQFAYNFGALETSMRVVNRAEMLDQLKAYVVKFPREPYQVLAAYKPTQDLDGSHKLNRAIRGYDTVPASKVLEDWAAACIGAYWINEKGVLTLADFRSILRIGQSRTVDLPSNAFSGSWATDTGTIYTRVIVKGKDALSSGNDNVPAVTVWRPEGNGLQELPEGQLKRTFIEVPEHEDWVGVDYDLKMPRNPNTTDSTHPKGVLNPYDFAGGDTNRYALGDVGSWWDLGVITRESLNKFKTDTVGNLKFASGLPWSDIYGKMERLGWRTILTEFSVYVKQGDRNKTFYLNYPDELLPDPDWTYMHYQKYYRAALPLIRAKFRTDWKNYTFKGKDFAPKANTPENLPSVNNWGLSPINAENVYEHNFDWWVSKGMAQELLPILEQQLTRETHTLEGVELTPDLERNIGDTEQWLWTDDAGQAWEAWVLIQSVSESWEGGYLSQKVNVVVYSYTPTEIRRGGVYKSPNEP